MPHRLLVGNPIIDTWVLLHQIADTIERCEELTFDKINTAVQDYQVLRAITCIKEVTTPMKITRFLDKSPNYITFILDRMEKEGTIIRTRDLKDRRAIRISLTPKGKEKYLQASSLADQLPLEILSVLSKAELKTLMTVLVKIREKSFEYRKVKDIDIIE